MQLETVATRHGDTGETELTALKLVKNGGVYCADWSPLIAMLMDSTNSVEQRAAGFHLSMAHTLLEQAKRVREDTGVNTVGLAGGVFQNRLLTEKSSALLNDHGFKVSLPLLMPVNDAAISFGQIIEYGYHRRPAG